MSFFAIEPHFLRDHFDAFLNQTTTFLPDKSFDWLRQFVSEEFAEIQILFNFCGSFAVILNNRFTKRFYDI